MYHVSRYHAYTTKYRVAIIFGFYSQPAEHTARLSTNTSPPSYTVCHTLPNFYHTHHHIVVPEELQFCQVNGGCKNRTKNRIDKSYRDVGLLNRCDFEDQTFILSILVPDFSLSHLKLKCRKQTLTLLVGLSPPPCKG